MHSPIRLVALSALLTAGCIVPADWDRDGYPAWEDCDDLDPSRHPGAVEVWRDKVDQDCRGGDIWDRVGGVEHTCFLTADGDVWCEGENSRQQLDLPPTLENGIWDQIAAGAYHTCALSELGEAVCWGDNSEGQSTTTVTGPFVSIDAGPFSSFGYWGITSDDDAKDFHCWGLCPRRDVEKSQQ